MGLTASHSRQNGRPSKSKIKSYMTTRPVWTSADIVPWDYGFECVTENLMFGSADSSCPGWLSKIKK